MEVDWGDGTSSIGTVTALPTSTSVGTFEVSKRFDDDHPVTGTPRDTRPFRIVIRDDDTGVGERRETVDLVNRRPEITSLQFTRPVIDEGENTVLKGVFTDQGIFDTHTVRASWSNGSASGTATFSVGNGTFEIPINSFVDDDPTGTSSDNVTFTVELLDDDTDQAVGLTTATLRVNNVVPKVTLIPASVFVDEGQWARFTIQIDDPGVRDTFKVKVDWGDRLVEEFEMGPGTSPLLIERRFPDDDPTATPRDNYTVTVTVEDDDTGAATASLPLTIVNLPPEVDAGPGQAVKQFDTVKLRGTVKDPGVQDTFTYEWKITAPDGSVISGGNALDTQFVPQQAGGYTATLTVTDDDGGVTSASTSVASLFVEPPHWEIPEIVPYLEGDTVTIGVFSGQTQLVAAHTVVVDWGDGTSSTHALMPGQPNNVTHVYKDDPPGTAVDYYTAKFTFQFTSPFINAGNGQSTVLIPVTNADPDVSLSVTPPAPGGSLYRFSGAFVDPGVVDTHTITWNFSDGTVLTNAGLVVSKEFSGAGSAILTVEDDDGGIDFAIVNFSPSTAQGATSPLPGGGKAGAITVAALDPLIAAAKANWSAVGADRQLFGGVTFAVADLGADILGFSVVGPDSPPIIYVDDDGAGRGWFVDATPATTEEYRWSDGFAAWSAAQGEAQGRIDLLTMISHELGHVLGLGHIEAGAPSVMAGSLHPGERRLPQATDFLRGKTSLPLKGPQWLLASGVTAGGFESATDWDTRGAVTLSSGTATLSEDPRLNSSLQQSLRIPTGARYLTFDIIDWAFGRPARRWATPSKWR